MSASDTDPRIAALETQVLAAPRDLALRSIYADALAAIGDPRGELLALEHRRDELVGADARVDPVLTDRIAQLSAQLLGDAAGLGVRWHHGFVEAAFDSSVESSASGRRDGGSVAERAQRLLAAPAARFLRALRIRALPGTMHHLLKAFRAAPRPYLTHLQLGFATFGPGPALLDYARTDLAEVAPRLAHLTLDGEPPPNLLIPDTVAHVDVRSLQTFAWFGRNGPHRALHTLSLTADPRSPDIEATAFTLRRERYPALRTLDLSGYEPVDRSHSTRLGLVQRILRMMLIGPQLERVIVPSLRDLADAMTISQLLAPFPLREIVVAHAYSTSAPAPTHPTATITVAPVAPYPALSSLVPSELLRIEVPGVPFTGPAPLAPLIAVLDRDYADLPASAQSAWTLLFELVAALPPFQVAAERRPFPAAVLAHALDSLALDLPSLPAWELLRRAIGPVTSSRLTVMVSRDVQSPS